MKWICIAVLAFFSCKTPESKQTASPDNARTSLDWHGIYRGMLPCSDCPAMEATVYLNRDQTYRIRLRRLDGADNESQYSGNFDWNDQGNTITLRALPSGITSRFFVGENTLTPASGDDSRPTGDIAARHTLSKGNFALLEKHWKLTELRGEPLSLDSSFRREPYIIFKDSAGRFLGNAGCNSMSGSYELKGMNRISMGKIITTKMFCSNMPIETEFLKLLQEADNFYVNGDVLVLNKAKMTPLARFRAVQMQD